MYNYDIACIQITRFDIFDSLDRFGFECLPLMTRTNAKIRSGRIAILKKEHLIDKIKILKMMVIFLLVHFKRPLCI